METQQPLRTLWSARWLLIACAILGAAAGYYVSDRMQDRYEAEALAQIMPRSQAAGQPLSTDQLLQMTNFYAELARTSPVQRSAERGAGVRRGEFDGVVEVEAQPDLLVLAFRAQDGSPAVAARDANAYARAFTAAVADLQAAERERALAGPQRRVAKLQSELEDVAPDSARASAINAELEALQTRLADEAVTPGDNVRVIQPALTPTDPAAPQPIRNAILAGIAALVLAASLLLARSALSDRYASIEEAALDLALPVLGELPRAKRDDRRAVEAFRKLRARLGHSLTGLEHGAVLVTSPEERTGKSYAIFGLARALAAEGSQVAAVDADLRRPTLHERFFVLRAPGLGDALDSRRPMPIMAVAQSVPLTEAARDRGGELAVIPAGSHVEDSSELLSGVPMTRAIETLTERYDMVLLDSPPVLAIADAMVLARHASAVVLVIDLKRSRRRAARRAVQALRGVDAPLLGLVNNRARESSAEYGYYGPRSEARGEPLAQ